jgi:diguanylate cyclase (GGDEF)-like protein
LLGLQNVILEMVAKGETLKATADALCGLVEALVPDVVCSVLTVDRAGLLHPLAAPGLPAAFSAALDGLAIGPNVGSCGSAAYERVPVTVTDIETDARWAAYKHLALPLGLRACWSTPILDGNGRVLGAFAFYFRQNRGPGQRERDVVATSVHLCAIAIERHERVVEHHRRANIDLLTGLANRACFDAKLAELSCAAAGAWALLIIDLDNLKVVNDTFGHSAGDALIQAAAGRIATLAAPDMTFRLGGDEFAVLVEAPEAVADLDAMARRILAGLCEAADCCGHDIVPRATIGGAVLTADDETAEAVRQNADFALYHAKETGRGGMVQHTAHVGTTMSNRLRAIRDVGAALREDRIDAYYQPVVNLRTGEIVGMEALFRLVTEDGRVLPAGDFFQATSDIHVASELTRRMLSIVAGDVRAWLNQGIPFQHVGVNVSSADFHGGKLEQQLTAAFERVGAPLKHVVLEVNEMVYMGQRDDVVVRAVRGLRAKGMLVALDDFGTGYASLTHLLSVPVDILKIDKSFVHRLAPDDGSVAIVEGLLAIAAKLGIRVVAEGIEAETQAAQLRGLGCKLGQGYLFSEPVDRHAASELLRRRAQNTGLAGRGAALSDLDVGALQAVAAGFLDSTVDAVAVAGRPDGRASEDADQPLAAPYRAGRLR